MLAGFSIASPLHAATITVNDASSGSVAGNCTIQDAVMAANTNAAVQGCGAGSAGLDTIAFAPSISSIVLTTAMPSANASCTFALAVGEDLNIDGGALAGSGIPKVTIARSSAASTPKFGIIGASNSNCGQTSAKLRLTVAGLTLSNGNNAGNFDGDGGGIAVGTLTISGSTINGNTARQGGGLYADALITLVNSTVSGNTASEGGGIYTSAITTNFVTVTANNGGADYRGGSGINLQVNEAGLGVEFDNSVSDMACCPAPGTTRQRAVKVSFSILRLRKT
jgi:predicted outer membrane repeat protein